jgi:cytochrome c oxidase subunit 2
MCHTVRGTEAGGRTAPDLTHFATRSTIAAGTVPNTREHLTAWIADPQHLKPGNKMPPTGLSAADLEAIVAYLETLR